MYRPILPASAARSVLNDPRSTGALPRITRPGVAKPFSAKTDTASVKKVV